MKWSVIIGVQHDRSDSEKGVCDTPNDRPKEFIVEKMNIASIRFNVARDNAEIVLNSGQNELFACAIKKGEMGMTPTPPWAGKEAARRRAHGLLDIAPNGEPKAVGLALDFEAMRRPRKNESEVE